MTRHERRKKAIYKKAKIEIYTAMANALHEKHGWGNKRLANIFELSNKYIEMEHNRTLIEHNRTQIKHNEKENKNEKHEKKIN